MWCITEKTITFLPRLSRLRRNPRHAPSIVFWFIHVFRVSGSVTSIRLRPLIVDFCLLSSQTAVTIKYPFSDDGNHKRKSRRKSSRSIEIDRFVQETKKTIRLDSFQTRDSFSFAPSTSPWIAAVRAVVYHDSSTYLPRFLLSRHHK